MKIKLKCCSCIHCKTERHHNRKKDRKITRFLNKSIRQANKKVCQSLGEKTFKAVVSYYYL